MHTKNVFFLSSGALPPPSFEGGKGESTSSSLTSGLRRGELKMCFLLPWMHCLCRQSREA
jgi:hypothetical protein